MLTGSFYLSPPKCRETSQYRRTKVTCQAERHAHAGRGKQGGNRKASVNNNKGTSDAPRESRPLRNGIKEKTNSVKTLKDQVKCMETWVGRWARDICMKQRSARLVGVMSSIDHWPDNWVREMHPREVTACSTGFE